MSRRPTLIYLLGAVAFGVLLHREQQRGAFEVFDRKHREFLRANPGQGRYSALSNEPQVMLARLDDPDLPPAQRAFEAWPPRTEEWQVVLQNLTEWKPQAVALALPLVADQPSPGLLATVAAVPGLSMSVNGTAAFGTAFPPPELPDGLPVLPVRGGRSGIPEFESLGSLSFPARIGIGEIDLGQKITVEGEWGRLPLLGRTGRRVVPTLALQSILTWSGIAPGQIIVEPGSAILGPRGMVIPIDEAGCFRFYLPLSVRAGAVQADEFLFSKIQAEITYPPGTGERASLGAVKGSLVWLGLDDEASRLFKLPDGNLVSAADLTTRALAAIQTGRFIRPLPRWWQAIPQAVVVWFGLWLVRWKRRNLWKGAATGALVLLTASLLAFQTDHTWIPLVPALLQLAAAFTVGLLLPKPIPPP